MDAPKFLAIVVCKSEPSKKRAHNDKITTCVSSTPFGVTEAVVHFPVQVLLAQCYTSIHRIIPLVEDRLEMIELST